MRTRNSARKKNPAKKGTPVSAADKTPESADESTPLSAKGEKLGTAPDDEPEVEELSTPVIGEMKIDLITVLSPEEKSTEKGKSPLGQKTSAEPPPVLEIEEVPVRVAEEEEKVKDEPKFSIDFDMNKEPECDPMEDYEEYPAGDQMGEDLLPEDFQEPVEEEPLSETREDVEGAEKEENREDGVEGEEAKEEVEEQGGPHINDDEQIEISDMAKRRKIKKEQEIFVGGLDRDAVEEEIKKAFEKVGEVIEVRLHKDFITNKNKGFAFVKFANKEQATRALSELKNPIIHGKRCGIAPSEDNDTLFLGNICNTWTKEAIKRKLQDYGVEGVEHITLVLDTQNEGLSRGFAFLEFSCHQDAMLAYKRLQKPDAIFGHPERTAKVAFAEPLREPDPEVMAQVKSVFVDGLPPYWDEDRVKEQFKAYGEIERVVLARNMSTAKRKDFGFVNFTTHEAAIACVEGVNTTEFGDGKSKIRARARLANPLPKTQAVKGGMSGGYRIGHAGIGAYPRFGRGFGRGNFFPHRAGFQGGRSFVARGRARGGRFSFGADNAFESFPPEFHTRRPFGVRGNLHGGRGFPSSSRHGTYGRGRGHVFAPRRPPYPPEEDFNRPFDPRYGPEDPYFYGDVGPGIKRPYSMMDHDPGYMQSTTRMRPRYNHPDPMPGGPHYRDSLAMGREYPPEYYHSDYGDNHRSSMYGREHSRGRYYY